jgi:type II secretory pathway pseudopilin PulG
MLVVIVIVGIMLALTLPAVNNLMKSGGVSAASRHVSNSLNLARQYAITHRTRTRVVFPYIATPANSQAPQYLSYTVLAYNSSVVVGGGWQYVGKWEVLPLGVVFLNGNVLGSGSLDNLPNDATMLFPNTATGVATPLAFIEFGPTGAASQAYTLTCQEGLMNGAGNPKPTSANASQYTVDNIIGRIKVTRLP